MDLNLGFMKLNVYSLFAAEFFPDIEDAQREHEKVSNDLQKLFPSCEYQGRSIKLKWRVCVHNDFVCPPNAMRDIRQPYDLFVAIVTQNVQAHHLAEINGNCLGSLLSPNYLRSYAKVLVVAPYDTNTLTGNQKPAPQIENILNGTALKPQFQNNPQILHLGYRQDKLASGEQDTFQDGHVKVAAAIQEIVNNKLIEMTKLKQDAQKLREQITKLNKLALKQQQQALRRQKQIAEIRKEIKDVQVKKVKEEVIDDNVKPAVKDTVAAQINTNTISKKITLFDHILIANLSVMISLITSIAIRTLWPQLKQAIRTEISAGVGLISFFVINYFKNHEALLNRTVKAP